MNTNSRFLENFLFIETLDNKKIVINKSLLDKCQKLKELCLNDNTIYLKFNSSTINKFIDILENLYINWIIMSKDEIYDLTCLIKYMEYNSSTLSDEIKEYIGNYQKSNTEKYMNSYYETSFQVRTYKKSHNYISRTVSIPCNSINFRVNSPYSIEPFPYILYIWKKDEIPLHFNFEELNELIANHVKCNFDDYVKKHILKKINSLMEDGW